MEEPNGAPENSMDPDADSAASDGTATAGRTLGAWLRQAREASGLSLADVAERTKVRPGILADIETDAHDRLPALTYALGFVKAYARTVGVDPAAAADAYRRESQKLDPAPSIVDLQPLEARRLPSRGLLFATTLLILLLLGGFWAWGAGWLTPAMEQTDAAPIAEAPADAIEPAADETPTDEPTAAETDRIVTIAANNEVWLQIADGDEIFFTGILQPGQSLTLPEGRPWLLRTGRAGALDIKVGEQALPPLGRPIENLRDVPLSPDALLARFASAAPTALAPAAATFQEGN